MPAYLNRWGGYGYNTGGYDITTTGNTTSTIYYAAQGPVTPPPPRKKTALEWLREQVDETCAGARVAA